MVASDSQNTSQKDLWNDVTIAVSYSDQKIAPATDLADEPETDQGDIHYTRSSILSSHIESRCRSDSNVHRRGKRAVRFDAEVQIQTIPSRRLLSKDELQNTYLTVDDKERIRLEVKKSIEKIAQVGAERAAETLAANGEDISATNKYSSPFHEDDPVEDEFRGLEFYELSNHRVRRQRMGRALNAVLRAQGRGGKLSEEWVHGCYKNLTAPSAWSAHVRGLLDQQIHLAAPPPVQIMIR